MNPDKTSKDSSDEDSQRTGNASGAGNVNASLPIKEEPKASSSSDIKQENGEEKPFTEKVKEQIKKGTEETKQKVEQKWRDSKAFRDEAVADIKEAFNKNNKDWDIGRICIIIVVTSLVTAMAIWALKIVYFIWSIIYWIFYGFWKD